nr:hypothetical protein [Tanacetum cinerariifolium]
MGGPIMLVPK